MSHNRSCKLATIYLGLIDLSVSTINNNIANIRFYETITDHAATDALSPPARVFLFEIFDLKIGNVFFYFSRIHFVSYVLVGFSLSLSHSHSLSISRFSITLYYLYLYGFNV